MAVFECKVINCVHIKNKKGIVCTVSNRHKAMVTFAHDGVFRAGVSFQRRCRRCLERRHSLFLAPMRRGQEKDLQEVE